MALALTSLDTAATPGFWQAATQADFLRGDLQQLSVDEHGRLMLGPEVERIHETGGPFVWTLVPGPDGSVFLGTGNDGKVLRVDRDGEATLVFDSDEMEVHALAVGAQGDLYVGTSPEGRIYRISPGGEATPFFDPDAKYIWALAIDPRGTVYAATGDKGEVFRITPDGKGSIFFSTKATHAVALAFDRSGNLLVGTGSPGRVFRVDPSGKPFLLLDTPYDEIRSLRVDAAGVLYAAAQSGRAPQGGDEGASPTPPEPAPPPSMPSVSTEITSIAILDVPVTPSREPSSAPSSDRREPAGAVYRVLPNGLWDQLWESRDDAPYDVAIEPEGTLLVATGSTGRIYRLAGEPVQPILLTRLSARQATMLHRSGSRTLVATSNPGQLVALSSGRATRGVYESDVKDARMVASWGTISWRAATPPGTRVEVQTRSGNTRTPDDVWSDWSPSYKDPEGSPIVSPNARYLQWRVVLVGSGDTPVLTSVTAAYLQRNIRPEITSITVHPPGVVFQKPFSSGETEIAGFDDVTMERRVAGGGSESGPGSPSLGRRTYEKGLQTFIWQADDDNGDELTYDVLYRREGDTSWKLLKSGLTDTILVWDTTSVPNGTYTIKVVASDRKSNPAGRALDGERESTSFEIDNSAPVVALGSPRRTKDGVIVPFEVRDADTAVGRVEYSLDAQRWQTVFPVDGILDSRREVFELTLDASASGRVLVVRATDRMGNVGTSEVVIK